MCPILDISASWLLWESLDTHFQVFPTSITLDKSVNSLQHIRAADKSQKVVYKSRLQNSKALEIGQMLTSSENEM